MQQVIVGESAAQGYVDEMGEPPRSPLITTDPESIGRAIEQFRVLLGDSFLKLERKDSRRVLQGQKHEHYRHPLMVLIARARLVAQSMLTYRPKYDLEALNLLGIILGLYQQFSQTQCGNKSGKLWSMSTTSSMM